MIENLSDWLRSLLGLDIDISDVDVSQMALRMVLIYSCSLALVRLASKRFLAKASALDVIVAIMLGSIMSRAVNSSAPFFPTIAAGAVLLGMHWIFAFLTYYISGLGYFLKGNRILLIKDGHVQKNGMRRASITHHDLAQAIREQTHATDYSSVQYAYFERSGEISVIPYKDKPQIIDVSVEEGVQTVRIKLH